MEDKHTQRWQDRLLPYMVGTIIALSIFFFGATVVQLYQLHQRIEASPYLPESEISELQAPNEMILRGLLEKSLIEKRYHQANTSLMNRIWLRYLGFITGMILAFIGAVFILGKLKIDETNVDVDIEKIKLNLVTSSPGIILAVLGTILMSLTIVTHHEISVQDAPIFVRDTYSSPVPVDVNVVGNPEKKDSTRRRPDF